MAGVFTKYICIYIFNFCPWYLGSFGTWRYRINEIQSIKLHLSDRIIVAIRMYRTVGMRRTKKWKAETTFKSLRVVCFYVNRCSIETGKKTKSAMFAASQERGNQRAKPRRVVFKPPVCNNTKKNRFLFFFLAKQYSLLFRTKYSLQKKRARNLLSPRYMFIYTGGIKRTLAFKTAPIKKVVSTSDW